jgi:hypothetical protein
MVLKKLVALYLCGLIQDDSRANFLFVALDDFWQWKLGKMCWLWNSMKEHVTMK